MSHEQLPLDLATAVEAHADLDDERAMLIAAEERRDWLTLVLRRRSEPCGCDPWPLPFADLADHERRCLKCGRRPS